MFGFNYNQMYERIEALKVNNTSSKITLEFCANPEAVDMTIKDWLKNNSFTKINPETKNNIYISGKERVFQYTVSIDLVTIYAYYKEGEVTNASIKSKLSMAGAKDAEKYGIEIYELLKLINALSVKNGLSYNTFTFENSKYNIESFKEDWEKICYHQNRECAQHSLTYCLLTFMGAACLILAISLIPDSILSDELFINNMNMRGSGILLLGGVLRLYIGCRLSFKLAFIALKTSEKKPAILAIIINILLVAACIFTLIFKIIGIINN